MENNRTYVSVIRAVRRAGYNGAEIDFRWIWFKCEVILFLLRVCCCWQRRKGGVSEAGILT
jgi:hypothetical protein